MVQSMPQSSRWDQAETTPLLSSFLCSALPPSLPFSSELSLNMSSRGPEALPQAQLLRTQTETRQDKRQRAASAGPSSVQVAVNKGPD